MTLTGITLPEGGFELSEGVAAAGVVASDIIEIGLVPGLDSDQNNPDMMDVIAMFAVPATDEFSIVMTFREPHSGPIKIKWRK